jgi:hypothetical protein
MDRFLRNIGADQHSKFDARDGEGKVVPSLEVFRKVGEHGDSSSNIRIEDKYRQCHVVGESRFSLKEHPQVAFAGTQINVEAPPQKPK